MADSPSIETLVSVGPLVPKGFHDFHKEYKNVPAFQKPHHPNSNDDISLMYFTSGTTGNPKMVAHDFTYPLGHIVTGCFWHNLHKDSLHLTIADTGWGKAVWGKLYGQWIAGATVFVYDHQKFTPADMEAATRHPLQSFADLITIEEYKKTARPKVVMTWAPHPHSLPQAVPNSFAEWMNAMDYEFVITQPHGSHLFNLCRLRTTS